MNVVEIIGFQEDREDLGQEIEDSTKLNFVQAEDSNAGIKVPVLF